MQLKTIMALVAVMFSILVSKSANADNPPGGPPADQERVCDDTALKECQDNLAACRSKPAPKCAPAGLPALPASKPPTIVCGVNTEKIPKGVTTYICACLPDRVADGYVLSDFFDYVTNTKTVSCLPSDKAVVPPPVVVQQQPVDMSPYQTKDEADQKYATKEEVNGLKRANQQPASVTSSALPPSQEQRLWALIQIGGTFRIGNRNDFNVGGGGAFSVTIFPWEVVGLHLKAEIGALKEPSDQAQIGKLWYAAGEIGPSVKVDHDGRFVVNLGMYIEQHWREAPKGFGLLGQNLGYGLGGMLSAGIRPVSWLTFEPYIAICGGPTSGWDHGDVAQDPLLLKINGGLRLFFTIPIFGQK